MLTGEHLRVRSVKKRIVPEFVDPADPALLKLAGRLIEIFRECLDRPRRVLEERLESVSATDVDFLLHRGLAQLLEDRCDLAVVSPLPPEDLRRAVFEEAAKVHGSAEGRGLLERDSVLEAAAAALSLEKASLEEGMYADLFDEQRIVAFKALSPERLLHRYNVGLAQAVVLRASRIVVRVGSETPARYRQFFRQLKFLRLVHQLRGTATDGYTITIDGPLSLFRVSRRYGLQLAQFLPVVLSMKDFDLRADLIWGKQGLARELVLSSKDGLVSHYRDRGAHLPKELQTFVDRFNTIARAWKATSETELHDLGGAGVFVPDFEFVHEDTGLRVAMELFGYWRRSGLMQRIELLKRHAPCPVLLGVSDRLRVDDDAFEDLPAGVFRFREIPVVRDVERLLKGMILSAEEG